MASASKNNFLEQSEIKTSDFAHKRKLSAAISNYNQEVAEGKKQFANLEAARKLAKNKKWQTIENLDQKLEEFERNFTAKGGKVIWASTAEEANKAIVEICIKNKCKSVLNSKNSVLEELQLGNVLNENNIELVHTDLGSYIQNLVGEAPYHITSPAIHKSKEDLAKLFYKKLNTEANLSPKEIAQETRKKLRPEYSHGTISITGADFLLASAGGVCISENEGSARLANSLAPIHIAVAGIEKMISSIKDLNLFWPLLATYSTGQKINIYNSIFTGPKQAIEADGPEEMYVILLDNGRSDIIANPKLRASSYCLSCGACVNASPVYKNIGGHAYGNSQAGPIGAILAPHTNDFEEYIHLSHASPLCGSCSAACPVGIDIEKLLRYNRSLSIEKNTIEKEERQSWKKWSKAMLNKGLFGSGSGGIKKVLQNNFLHENNNRHSKKTFKQLYKESKKTK